MAIKLAEIHIIDLQTTTKYGIQKIRSEVYIYFIVKYKISPHIPLSSPCVLQHRFSHKNPQLFISFHKIPL